jgi:ribosomal protein L11 methyltransferase
VTGERVFTRCTLETGGEDYDRVVAALLDLPLAGWQESDGTFTFWVPRGAEISEPTISRFSALRELGRLWCEPEEGGWEERWRHLHRAATVGGVTVRPQWVPPESGTVDVAIDIGMAFGTGSHVTTRQCLGAVQRLPVGSLLDVGTGSGVLAIAALRLGFGPVYALDYDPIALAQAERNARLNDVDLFLLLADVCDPTAGLPAAEVVVANLALKPIVALGERYARAAEEGRQRPLHVVLGGLLEEQVDEALAAFYGYALVGRETEGGWVLARLEASGGRAGADQTGDGTAASDCSEADGDSGKSER